MPLSFSFFFLKNALSLLCADKSQPGPHKAARGRRRASPCGRTVTKAVSSADSPPESARARIISCRSAGGTARRVGRCRVRPRTVRACRRDLLFRSGRPPTTTTTTTTLITTTAAQMTFILTLRQKASPKVHKPLPSSQTSQVTNIVSHLHVGR